jgi:hypothetical protein
MSVVVCKKVMDKNCAKTKIDGFKKVFKIEMVEMVELDE